MAEAHVMNFTTGFRTLLVTLPSQSGNIGSKEIHSFKMIFLVLIVASCIFSPMMACASDICCLSARFRHVLSQRCTSF